MDHIRQAHKIYPNTNLYLHRMSCSFDFVKTSFINTITLSVLFFFCFTINTNKCKSISFYWVDLKNIYTYISYICSMYIVSRSDYVLLLFSNSNTNKIRCTVHTYVLLHYAQSYVYSLCIIITVHTYRYMYIYMNGFIDQ